jgi:aspartate racemase
MKIAGMIGGLGPESTVDYYRFIIAQYRVGKPDGGYPHLIVNSLDVNHVIALLNDERLGDLTDYLTAGVELLARAGAHFGFMASNTPHIVFEEVQRRSRIPLLSIVRAASAHANTLGLKRLALFGTGFTMRARFYPEEFARAGMALIRPKESEQEIIHRKYIDELLNNRFLSRNRDRDSEHCTADDRRRRRRSAGLGRYGTPSAVAQFRRIRREISRYNCDPRRRYR